MRLQDKVAIITGSGRGIGRAYALRFAREGAKVVVADNNLENAKKVVEEIKADGGKALALYSDISDEVSTIQMAKETVQRFGGLDILVNNAGVYGNLRRTPWDTWTEEEWNKVFRVNVVGMWFCIKAAAPYMIKQRKGKIINIASIAVYQGPPNVLPYNCSKAAVNAMTLSLARELGPHNINVNSIAPGFTRSEGSVEPYKDRGADYFEMRMQEAANGRCLKRVEMPEDIVGTAVFLASEDSDFITGQVIVVDGGGTFRF